MDAALVSRIIEDIERENVELIMPNFEFESEFILRDTLKAMGMPNAFDRRHMPISQGWTAGRVLPETYRAC